MFPQTNASASMAAVQESRLPIERKLARLAAASSESLANAAPVQRRISPTSSDLAAATVPRPRTRSLIPIVRMSSRPAGWLLPARQPHRHSRRRNEGDTDGGPEPAHRLATSERHGRSVAQGRGQNPDFVRQLNIQRRRPPSRSAAYLTSRSRRSVRAVGRRSSRLRGHRRIDMGGSTFEVAVGGTPRSPCW